MIKLFPCYLCRCLIMLLRSQDLLSFAKIKMRVLQRAPDEFYQIFWLYQLRNSCLVISQFYWDETDTYREANKLRSVLSMSIHLQRNHVVKILSVETTLVRLLYQECKLMTWCHKIFFLLAEYLKKRQRTGTEITINTCIPLSRRKSTKDRAKYEF